MAGGLPLTKMAAIGRRFSLVRGASRGSDWWIPEARQGGAGRGGTGPGLAGSGIRTMSWARSHLRSALSLAAVSARGATAEGAARRWLSAWPAPQEPGMEYQVSDPRWDRVAH